MTFKILGHGCANLDYIFITNSFPLEDHKIKASRFLVEGGGNAANTMVGLSRLNCKTKLLTLLGADNNGKEIIESLEKEDVNCSAVAFDKGNSSIATIIVNKKNNSRTIISNRGQSYDKKISFDENILEGIDAVYIDGRFYKSGLKLAKLAFKKNIPVFLEAERKDLFPEKIFPYATVVFTSETYHTHCIDSKDFAENLSNIIEQGPKISTITIGEEGSLLKTKEKLVKGKIHPVEVVDTTGAGDAFNAGFIYAYLMNFDHDDILRFASFIASRKCTEIGARKGLPYLKDIKYFKTKKR